MAFPRNPFRDFTRKPFRAAWGVPALVATNAEVTAWLAAIAIKPQQSRVDLLDAMFNTMKAANVTFGASGDVVSLQIYAGHDQAATLTDLANPARVATMSGSPVWAIDHGVTFNLSNWIDTGLNTTGIVSSNSESMGVYCLDEGAANTYACGSFNTAIQPRRSTGNQVNASSQSATGTTGTAGTATTRKGMSNIDRSTSGTIRFLRDGVFYENLTRTSTGISNMNIFVGGRNNSGALSGGSIDRVGAFWHGKTTLADAKHLAISSAIDTYQRAIGART